jgi:hypothetical protein
MKRKPYTQDDSFEMLLSTKADLGPMFDDGGRQSSIIKGIYVSTSSRERRLVGVCGNQYQAYQYADVAEVANNALTMMGIEPERKSFLIGDGESMRLRYTVKNPEWEITSHQVGDKFSCGLEFSTGHQGYIRPQSIQIAGFITRLSCLNGMTSERKEFKASVRHFDTVKVDGELIKKVNNVIKSLKGMVRWFESMHPHHCTKQEGINTLENISMLPSIRENMLNVWDNQGSWIGVDLYNKAIEGGKSRNLGNLLNCATQVLSRSHSDHNIVRATRLSSLVFDTMTRMVQSGEYRTEMFKPREWLPRGRKVQKTIETATINHPPKSPALIS